MIIAGKINKATRLDKIPHGFVNLVVLLSLLIHCAAFSTHLCSGIFPSYCRKIAKTIPIHKGNVRKADEPNK